MKGLADMPEPDDCEFSGEFEKRMLTHIALLDRMIDDGDREILRLQELLATIEVVDAHDQGLSSAEAPVSPPSMNAGGRMRHPDARIFRPADNTGNQKRAA
jgi:hypothetical protein